MKTITVSYDQQGDIMRTFEIGQVYYCRSLCDYDCIYQFEIVKRSEKFVWIKYHNDVTRRKIFIDYNGHEAVHPHGTYSMCPTLSADRLAA